MWRSLLLATALVLGGCKEEKFSNPGKDGYWMETTAEKQDLNIRVILHPSLKDLKASYPAKAGKAPDQLMGYSLYNKTTCWIHIVDPAVHYEPIFMGHELNHCIYGRWHPNQPRNQKG